MSVECHEKNDRVAFVRKVLCIVTVQLAFTMVIAYCSAAYPAMAALVTAEFTEYVFIPIAIFGSSITLCIKDYRDLVPLNYILLSLFTLG